MTTAQRQSKNKTLSLPLHICFIGRLEPEKGIDLLVEIINLYLSNTNEKVVFDICGDGSLSYKIDILVAKYPNNVVYHGFVQNISNQLRTSSVLILTSVVETFGLVVLEAFENEVPVIATSVGGIPEIINDNENGFLVPYGNIELFVNRIRTLINDENLADRFVKSALISLNEKFSIETSINQYLNLINTL